MKVLITNIQLSCGGSETWCYTMAKELIKRGHDVGFMAPNGGIWEHHFRQLGPVGKNCNSDLYDVVLCNHISCQKILKHKCPIIRTCHGPEASEEQPMIGADFYVSVSKEVSINLEQQGFKSIIINNGIDQNLFNPTRKPSDILKNILVLTDYADNAEPIIEMGKRKDLNVSVIGAENKVFNTVKYFDWSDLVISVGRGAYEGLMMDRPVYLYDGKADGWLNEETVDKLLENNCSGRTHRLFPNALQWDNIPDQYPCQLFNNRELALNYFNSTTMCLKYLNIIRELGVKC